MEQSDDDLELKGNITVPQSEEEDDGTLDEPIVVTLVSCRSYCDRDRAFLW